MHYIVSYSGGAASWAAGKLTRDHVMADGDEMTLLFADTLIEDEDTYRFLQAGAENLGVAVTRIADGRTPWEVFRDVSFLGNHRVDPCSRVLKREPLDKWVSEAAARGPVTQVLGLDWTEEHRFERFRARVTHPVIAPLIDHHIDKVAVHAMVEAAGLPMQRLYRMGMPHANCGGLCVKAGISSFRRMYRMLPDRFVEWEGHEAELREQLGDVAILRDRSDGESRPLPLSELRAELELQPMLFGPEGDGDDWGGCGCAIDP